MVGKTRLGLLGALGCAAALLLVPESAQADALVGCTVIATPVAGEVCEFVGDGTSDGSGYVATTTGSWKLERVTASGVTLIASGAGIGGSAAADYTFQHGAKYRVTAGTGVGVVSASNGE